MKDNWVKKGLVFTIILLFIGVAIQPGISTNTIQDEKTDVDAKDYLFQSIIDISNNPDIKNLFGQLKQNHRIFTSDYDYKDVFLQILLKKPRLLKSMLFTRPEMTYEYLEANYNRGLEIVDILGEKETSKIVESVKITNPELFNELKNIFLNDGELSDTISNLEKMNLDWDFPIICKIIFIILISLFILYYTIAGIIVIFFDPIGSILFLPFHLLIFTLIIIFGFTGETLDCEPLFPYPYIN